MALGSIPDNNNYRIGPLQSPSPNTVDKNGAAGQQPQPVEESSPQSKSVGPVADQSKVTHENAKTFEFENGAVSFEKPLSNLGGTAITANVGRLREACLTGTLDAGTVDKVADALDRDFMSLTFEASLDKFCAGPSDSIKACMLSTDISADQLQKALQVATESFGPRRLTE